MYKTLSATLVDGTKVQVLVPHNRLLPPWLSIGRGEKKSSVSPCEFLIVSIPKQPKSMSDLLLYQDIKNI